MLKLINLFSNRISSPPSFDQVCQAEHEFIASYLRPGMTVFDIGANTGKYTIEMAQAVGESGKVYALEPFPETFDKLKQATENLSQIVHINAAASESRGVARFYVYESSSWNSCVKRDPAEVGCEPQRVVEVPAVTVDDLCDQYGIAHIDLMKVDTEGHELASLRGAVSSLKQHKVSCLLFEFGNTTRDAGVQPQDLANFLTDCGYKFRNLIKNQKPFPVHNGNYSFSMIVAEPERRS